MIRENVFTDYSAPWLRDWLNRALEDGVVVPREPTEAIIDAGRRIPAR